MESPPDVHFPVTTVQTPIPHQMKPPRFIFYTIFLSLEPYFFLICLSKGLFCISKKKKKKKKKKKLSRRMESDEAQEERAEFAYGIGLAVGVTVFVIVIIFVSYYYRSRHYFSTNQIANSSFQFPDLSSDGEVELGLDEKTLKTLPEVRFSQAKLHDKQEFCCSICLADYKDDDNLRLLPDCGHIFHHKCVDPWLRIRATCPLCRDLAGTISNFVTP